MTKDDSIIFLTDKYGRRDRTTEIENISYDVVAGVKLPKNAGERFPLLGI